MTVLELNCLPAWILTDDDPALNFSRISVLVSEAERVYIKSDRVLYFQKCDSTSEGPAFPLVHCRGGSGIRISGLVREGLGASMRMC